MTNHSIKAVVFDHGGVLSRGGEKGTNEKAASRAMGLAEVIAIPDLNEALKCGRIGNEEYVQEINRRFPDAPRALTMGMWDEVYASLTPDPLAYEFARCCRDSGLRTAILTSINPAMADRLQADGSYDGFAPLVMSCYVGCAKPDPAIYRLVEDGLGDVEPSAILFLDDQDKCCDGARRCGWQAVRVDSSEQMVRDAGNLLGLG
jgi:epoxide hydrolase-like predicted phosphatase